VTSGESAGRVYDASVILAIILRERGHEPWIPREQAAVASAVNIAEARSRLSDRGFDRPSIDAALRYINLDVVDFDGEQAVLSADLRPATRKAGLSLGDRACLALAMQMNAVAYTADRAWTTIDLPVDVQAIR
jgi:PIN domain nuclease of toxin-antitoxin system